MAAPSPIARSPQAFQHLDTLIHRLEEIKKAHLENIAHNPAIDSAKKTLTPEQAFAILYPTALDLTILKILDTKKQTRSKGYDDAMWQSTPRINQDDFQQKIAFLDTIATYYSKIPKMRAKHIARRGRDEWEMLTIEVAYMCCLEDLLVTFLQNQHFQPEEFLFWSTHKKLLDLLPIADPGNKDQNTPLYHSVIFNEEDVESILTELLQLARSGNHPFILDQKFDQAKPAIDRLQIIDRCLKKLPNKENNFSAFFMLLNLYRIVLSHIDVDEAAWLQESPAEKQKCLAFLKKTWSEITSLVSIDQLKKYPLVANQFNATSDFYTLVIKKACLPDTKKLIQSKPSAQRHIIDASNAVEEKFTIPTTYAPIKRERPGLDLPRFEDASSVEMAFRENMASFQMAKDALRARSVDPLSLEAICRIGTECDSFLRAIQSFSIAANLFPACFERIFQKHFRENSLPFVYKLLDTMRPFISDKTFFEESSEILALYEAELFQVAFNAVNKTIPKNICSVQLREEGMIFSIHSDEKAYLSAALKAIGTHEGFSSNISKKTITLAFSQTSKRHLDAFLNALNTNLQNAHNNLIAKQAPIVNMPAAPSIPAEEKQKLQAQYAQEEAAQKALEARRKAREEDLEARQPPVTIASNTTATTTKSEEEKAAPFADILTVEALLQTNLSNQLKDILNNPKAYPPGTPAYHVQTGQLHMYVVLAADALQEMTEAENMILAEKRETGREFVLDKFPNQGWLFRMKAPGDRRLAGHYLPETHTVTLPEGDAVVVTLDKQWDHSRGLRAL